MSKFLLIVGTSGVGKTTLIKHLKTLDPRFVYVSPYITRPLRPGETDKIFVDRQTLDRMEAGGEFLTINEIYGVHYATPIQPILSSLRSHSFPLLDWPQHRMGIMREHFHDVLYTVYLVPPSLEVLKDRIGRDGRDTDGSRYVAAQDEYQWHESIQCDLRVVSVEGQIPAMADFVYQRFLESLERR